MKYFYTILLFSLFFVGCGYKADPIYVDETKQIKVEN